MTSVTSAMDASFSLNADAKSESTLLSKTTVGEAFPTHDASVPAYGRMKVFASLYGSGGGVGRCGTGTTVFRTSGTFHADDPFASAGSRETTGFGGAEDGSLFAAGLGSAGLGRGDWGGVSARMVDLDRTDVVDGDVRCVVVERDGCFEVVDVTESWRDAGGCVEVCRGCLLGVLGGGVACATRAVVVVLGSVGERDSDVTLTMNVSVRWCSSGSSLDPEGVDRSGEELHRESVEVLRRVGEIDSIVWEEPKGDCGISCGARVMAEVL